MVRAIDARLNTMATQTFTLFNMRSLHSIVFLFFTLCLLPVLTIAEGTDSIIIENITMLD